MVHRVIETERLLGTDACECELVLATLPVHQRELQMSNQNDPRQGQQNQNNPNQGGQQGGGQQKPDQQTQKPGQGGQQGGQQGNQK